MHSPNTFVPTTDQEVQDIINGQYSGDKIFKGCMLGIYQARRGLKDSVVDAYIYTLRCHVDPDHPSLKN